MLAAEGKNEDAIAAMRAGIKLAPGDEAARRDLAELYTTAGKNDLAEAEYRTLVVAHPNDAELHRRLGQALLREKKPKDAQQEFLTAVKLKPDLGEAYGDLAFAAGENENYELAIKALDVRSEIIAGECRDLFSAGLGVRSSAAVQAGGGELSPLSQHGKWEVS